MLQPGDRIGPLRVERALGAGGMGEVWLARDERLERLVAVKLLPAESRLDPAARGRMLREARAASGLKHPGIVTVHDIGDHDGRAYIVLEYVEGETFEALVKRRGPLPAAEAVELVAQVGDAVAVAHAAGILHRDLKAQNLMLDGAGRVKVLDFGLSKRTDTTSLSGDHGPSSSADVDADDSAAMAATVIPDAATTPAAAVISQTGSSGRSDEPLTAYGVRMGTPGWASPELMNGGLSDVRSDVFALGAVLYHLLTGSMPFPARTWGELRDQIEQGPTPPSAAVASIPRALDDVVLAALSARPDRRPTSARAFIDAARAALAPRRSRTRLFVGAGAAAAVGVTALVIAGGGIGAKRTHEVAAPAHDAGPRALDAAPYNPVPHPITSLGGCAYLPAFLDEDTVSFDLTRSGTVDLYTLDLGGQPVQRTSMPGWEWRSGRGANAHEVIFLEETTDNHAFASRLNLDDGSVTRLFPVGGPVVQVGDMFFHSPGEATTLRRRVATRDEVFLQMPTDHAVDSMVASPDGSMLAMLTFGESQLASLCITPTAHPDLRCFKLRVASTRPAWSSDGTAVYTLTKGGLSRVDAMTGEIQGTPTPMKAPYMPHGGLAVSPSGAHFVFSACNTQSHLFAPNSADPKTPLVGGESAGYPQFGPERQLAYVGGSLANATVVVRDETGTMREVVNHGEARITGPAFSDDGQLIAYSVGNASEPGLYLTDVASSAAPNRLTDRDGDREPLILGDTVYFTRDDDAGAPRLMRVSLDGSRVEMASNRPRRSIAVDRRTRRLLLSTPSRDYLYWWDPATGVEKPGPVVPKPTGDISISPDGRWLLVLQGENGDRAYRMPLDRPGKLEQVYTSTGDVTSGKAAIDDDGIAVIQVTTWAGELWQLDAPAGARW